MTTNAGDNLAAGRIDVGVDGDRAYVLSPLDNDRFVRTGKQIIEACQLHIGYESWKQNLADLWEEVKTLGRLHRSRVGQVLMLPRNGTVHVLFVTDGGSFDFDLAEALAELNIRLRRQEGMYGDVEASQIPKGEFGRFVEASELGDALKSV